MRLSQPLETLEHRLITQFTIDQKCAQFIYWDSIVDFKRLSLQYQHLYKYYSCQQSTEAANIQKDIERTFSQHPYFKQIHNRQKLQRILVALSKMKPQLGYIQGFNQIAACFLIGGLNEQQTFWMMHYILSKKNYSEIFLNDFRELNFLNFAVAVFLRNYVPTLSNEFVTLQSIQLQSKIDISIITTRWFLVIFGYDLPQILLIQIWNMFLQKGIKILIKTCVAIFQLISDFEGIDDLYELLKDDLVDLLEQDVELQRKLINNLSTFKITNRLIEELRIKFETDDESLTLSFDQNQKKHYWRKGGDSAKSLFSSVSEIISEIQDEKDQNYQQLHSLLPKLINKNYLVAQEGKKNLLIKIEKRPQLIKRQKISQQPKMSIPMSIPQSANGDQVLYKLNKECNIYADELQSKMSLYDDDSIDIECTPEKIFKFSNNKMNQ